MTADSSKHHKPHGDRPGRRIGNVGQAYLEARATQSERARKALKRIAEGM